MQDERKLVMNNVIYSAVNKRVENVIIVNDFGYVDGGASSVAIRTAVELADKGLKVTFFCGEAPVCDELKNSSVNVVCTDQKSLMNNPSKVNAALTGLWNKKAKREFEKLLSRYSVENTAVHFHTWTKCLSSSVFEAAEEKGFLSFLTLHDYFSACPNGAFYDYRKNVNCGEKPMSAKCVLRNCDQRSYLQKVYRILRQAVQNRYVKNSKNLKLIYVSKFSRKILEKDYFSDRTSYLIQNPYSRRSIAKSAKQKSKFAFIGRLDPEKNPYMFCKACTELNVPGIVIGAGEQSSFLKEKFPNIEFTGWLKEKEISDHIPEIKALVFPSLWYETAGLTVLQFLEMGIPCVVSSNCAATDYINSGKNGYVFNVNDIEDLKSKMLLSEKLVFSPSIPAEKKDEYADQLIAAYEKELQKRVNLKTTIREKA